MPPVRSSELASATVTQLLEPLNDRALPNLPAADHEVFARTPLFPRPDVSAVVLPAPSSKPYAPTSPVGAVLLTVTGTGLAVVVLPAASRATAVSEWLPLEAVVVSHETE